MKALGGGKCSVSSFFSSTSSKFLVSVSPDSSGTTGATAEKNLFVMIAFHVDQASNTLSLQYQVIAV